MSNPTLLPDDEFREVLAAIAALHNKVGVCSSMLTDISSMVRDI